MYVRPWILRQRGARQSLTMAVLQVLPSATQRSSALRMIGFSLLNCPGHTRRYRRFTSTLASARARLAVKVVVNLSFLPNFHRLPQRQLARRSHVFHLLRMPTPIPRRKRPGASVACFPARRRPSPFPRWVGFRIARFEACSAFTRIPACAVAEPPKAALLAAVLQTMSLPP